MFMLKLAEMHVDEYLKRLNYTGRTDVSKETLFGLQEAHLKTIPYENLDIHLGVRVGLELPRTYNKIILENRGGWCFELNGLLAWLLTELGFDLKMHGAIVVPEETTPSDVKEIEPKSRSHVVLIVTVDGESYLTDVGFGPSCIQPLPLKAGQYTQNNFSYALHNTDDFWFFENHKGLGGHFYFDSQTFELPYFQTNCTWLQTSPESHFVQTSVTYIYTDKSIISLKGNSLRIYSPDGFQDKIIQSKDEYIDTLKTYFSLEIKNVDRLWNSISEKALSTS